MTQEEAINFLSNTKVFVKDKSKEIQEKLFEIGFIWYEVPNTEPKYLTKPFLYICENRSITYGNDVNFFYSHRHTEISAEDILKIKVEHLPKTWGDFCINNPVSDKEAYIAYNSKITTASSRPRISVLDKNTLPSYEAAVSHRALMQLHQLRDCYRGDILSMYWYSIIRRGESDLIVVQDNNRFLSFPTRELAEEFLTNFKDLIEEAGDLI